MNLALLRLLAILIAANGLGALAALLLQVTMGDEGDSFVDIIPMIIVCVVTALVGVIVLVKKSAKPLMVYSIIAIILDIVGNINFVRGYLGLETSPGVGFLLQGLASHLINILIAVYVTSLFVGRMKTPEGCRVNLGLLRFCAVVFLINGFDFLVHIGDNHSVPVGIHFLPVVIMMVASIAAGIFVLVKNNTLVLKAFAVCSVLWFLWVRIEFVRENMFGSYYVASAIVSTVFSAHLVVYVATFFVDVEESKLYLQKLKALFFKWKNLT